MLSRLAVDLGDGVFPRIIAPANGAAHRDAIPPTHFPRSKHFMIRLFSALAATTILCGCAAQPASIASSGPAADAGSRPAAAVPAAADQPRYGTYGFDTAGMDRAVAPGDNFYQYANGTWARTTPIPADRSNYGMFSVLEEVSQERTRTLIEEQAQDP